MKAKTMTIQESHQIMALTKDFHIKLNITFAFPTTGMNFDRRFPNDYHIVGDTAPDIYLQNVFKYGFIHSIVAASYGKWAFLSATDRKEIAPLTNKIYYLFDHSLILQELSVMYQRNKIIEQKTHQIFLFMDKLNLVLTLYINLLIAVFMDISMNNIKDLCDTIHFDILYVLFATLKNYYYRHSISTTPVFFLYEIFPNLVHEKKSDIREILKIQFSDIVSLDLSATLHFAHHFLIID